MSRQAQRWTVAGGTAPLAERIEWYVRLLTGERYTGSQSDVGLITDHRDFAERLASRLYWEISRGIFDELYIQSLNERYPQTGVVYILDAGAIRPIKATPAERAALPNAADFFAAAETTERESRCQPPKPNPQMRLKF